MYEKERVQKFSKISFFLLLSCILIVVLFYLIIGPALYKIFGSISGNTVMGYILMVFAWYLPIILFAGTILFSFINYFINNPHNRNLSLCHLFFALAIPTAAFIFGYSVFAYFTVPYIFYTIFVLSLIFLILSIVYGSKAKKDMEEWKYQCFTIIILSILAILGELFWIYTLLFGRVG
jgi:hypothetical protein